MNYEFDWMIVLTGEYRQWIIHGFIITLKISGVSILLSLLIGTFITSLTTLMVVVVLAFAFGEVKIFAVAMIVGVMVGTYSSIYIAGPVVIAWQKRFHAKNK